MEQNMLKCLRCETEMVLFKHEKIQLGEQSFWHNWNHLIHGALDVDIYVCPQCGKNWNEGSCNCKPEVLSPFAVLKGKFK